MDLEHRFNQLAKEYTQDSRQVKVLWDELYNAHHESHRTYHNMRHLQELFRYVDQYKHQLASVEAVSFAVFYHDSVYKLTSKKNEELSAKLAKKALTKINVPKHLISLVTEMILATKKHEGSGHDIPYFIDFDLAILGQSEAIYDNYVEKLREEYEWVPQVLFNRNRKAVLQRFLDRSFLYQTAEFRNEFEVQARANIAHELKNL